MLAATGALEGHGRGFGGGDPSPLLVYTGFYWFVLVYTGLDWEAHVGGTVGLAGVRHGSGALREGSGEGSDGPQQLLVYTGLYWSVLGG